MDRPEASRLRIAAVLLFSLELAGAIAAFYYLHTRYNGVMSIGFCFTLPILGLLTCTRMADRSSPLRKKTLAALQVLLLIAPPLLLISFFPTYSYEEAKTLVEAHRQNAAPYTFVDEKRSAVKLSDSSNPLVDRAYVLTVLENGHEKRFIVNPVNGKVTEWND